MGAATRHLDTAQRETIARELLTGAQPNLVNGRVASHCPMHQERTKGGAFFYDPAEDLAYCHSCGGATDLVGLFCLSKGLEEDDPQGFREFFERYAPGKFEEGTRQRRMAPAPQRTWQPRQTEPSPKLWQERAAAFVARRADVLQETPAALAQLARWGISAETARLCRIGWREEDRFYRFTHWGLPYAENDKGRERCIFAPRGLVFPCYQRGRLVRIKVRVDNPGENGLRYRALEGGETAYGVWGNPETCHTWIVVETERDAILCWQELHRYGIGAMSTGSASIAPDAYAHKLLMRADCIINALDNDFAGAKKSWSFDPAHPRFAWSAYPHAVRWLVPSCIGKDVGDLPMANLKVMDWLRPGLPPHVLLTCQRQHARIRPPATQDGEPGPAAQPPAAPAVHPFPPAESLAPRLTPVGAGTYAEVLECAARYGLALAVEGQQLTVTYAEGVTPHVDAHQYVQNLIDDPLSGLRAALQEVAA